MTGSPGGKFEAREPRVWKCWRKQAGEQGTVGACATDKSGRTQEKELELGRESDIFRSWGGWDVGQ